MASRALPALIFSGVMATHAQASVEISNAPTTNMSCSGGVCTPTAKKAVMNTADLANMLAQGDTTITTGAGAVTITVADTFSWTSASRLTLDAELNVSLAAHLVVAGSGALTVVTNDGGSGGDLVFLSGGAIDFWDLSSSLVINGDSYTLENDLDTLASDIGGNLSGNFALAADDPAKGRFNSIAVFHGKFSGLGHRISKLRLHVYGNLDYAPRDARRRHPNENLTGGFFGYLYGQASGIDLVDEAVIDTRKIRTGRYPSVHLGGVAAVVGQGGIVKNIHVSGTIGSSKSEQAYAGGIAGFSAGTISNVRADVAVACVDMCEAGGIAAETSGPISRSAATGSVTCSAKCGAGGLAGGNGSTIDQSYASMTVIAGGSANDYAYSAGLFDVNDGAVTNCYAFGSVGAATEAGGLVAQNGGNLSAVYSTVEVGNAGLQGGLVAYDIGATYANAYWDLDTSGIDDPSKGVGNIANAPGVTGLSDAQLKSGLPAGFDPAIWAQSASVNNGYPYLIANPPQ